MMYANKIFPTRWPLFEFHLVIWKLSLGTAIMRGSMESLTYEYIAFFVRWGWDELYRFRLYDTYKIAVEKKEKV